MQERCRFDPWVRKIPWRTLQPTPVFLLGGTQEPGRIQPTGSQRVGHAEVSEHTCMHYIACFRYESEVAQSCPTLCDPMDCSLLGSSIHGIFQARILEWVAISFSSGSSRPRDQTRVSFIVGRCFYRLSHQGGP